MVENTGLLKIYTDENAYFGDRTVSSIVVERVRGAGLAGATVFEAILGFGHSTHAHRHHLLERDRAIVIEVIDAEPALRAFAKSLSDLPHIGLITLEGVEILAGANPTIPES